MSVHDNKEGKGREERRVWEQKEGEGKSKKENKRERGREGASRVRQGGEDQVRRN